MLYFIQCKNIANWLNLHCFYNILVKYTTVVFGIFPCVIFLNTLVRDGAMPLIDLRPHQQPNKHLLLLPWENLNKKKAAILNTAIMITSPS